MQVLNKNAVYTSLKSIIFALKANELNEETIRKVIKAWTEKAITEAETANQVKALKKAIEEIKKQRSENIYKQSYQRD